MSDKKPRPYQMEGESGAPQKLEVSEFKECCEHGYYPGTCGACAEIADLRAQLLEVTAAADRLQEERDELRQMWGAGDRISLLAEVTRLRMGLRLAKEWLLEDCSGGHRLRAVACRESFQSWLEES